MPPDHHNPDTHIHRTWTFNSHTHAHMHMIDVFSSWWQDVHSLVAHTNKLTHGSDVLALKSAPASTPRGLSPLFWPQVAMVARDISQAAKVSDIWSCICDVTNSWLVIRPLGKREVRNEWGEGLIFNRPLAGTLSAFASSCWDYKLNDCH